MIFFLVSLIVILALALAICSYAYYKLGIKVLELEEQVEESLDVMDACYARISKATLTPVASDDPIVVGIIRDVQDCRNAILEVANKIVTFSEQK